MLELAADTEKPWQIIYCVNLFSVLTPERRNLIMKTIEKQLREQESESD